MFSRVNGYQLALDGDQVMFTLVYGSSIPLGDLHWANAGHLPPLIREPSGAVRFLETGSPPIGVGEVEYESMTETLGSGSSLVLVTDGLVERRGESLDAGFARLAQAIREGPAEPRALCEYMLGRLLPAGRRAPRRCHRGVGADLVGGIGLGLQRLAC